MKLVWALLLILLAAPAMQAQDYPTRNVTFIVPTGAGAGTDLLARILAPRLSERLGKPFVVENRPGAGTVIAADAVAKASPDGYTILMGTSTPLAINVTLHKKLPYDPAKDFMPLALIATVPFVLVINNDLPAKSVREFIELAKSKPGAFSYGSTGPGTPFHLYAELFSSMTGIRMVHVPYKAAVAALVDLMGGRLQVMMTDLASSRQLIREGKVRALGVTTQHSRRCRSGNCPDRRARGARVRSRGLADGGRAGGDPKACRRQIACRAQGHHGDAGDAASDRPHRARAGGHRLARGIAGVRAVGDRALG